MNESKRTTGFENAFDFEAWDQDDGKKTISPLLESWPDATCMPLPSKSGREQPTEIHRHPASSKLRSNSRTERPRSQIQSARHAPLTDYPCSMFIRHH